MLWLKTRKHLYLLIEAALSVIVLISFVWLCIIQFNALTVVLSLLGAFYFIQKNMIGIKLLIDIIEGSHETQTVFMGIGGTDHLAFFYKTFYTFIYFDDLVLTKNYYLFDGVCNEDLHPDDVVLLKYYRHSRIVLQLCKYEDKKTFGRKLL